MPFTKGHKINVGRNHSQETKNKIRLSNIGKPHPSGWHHTDKTRKKISAKKIKHGHSKRSGESSTYTCWLSMRARCNRTYNASYGRYGARGIKVCDRWDKFVNFLSDMGKKPLGKTIERVNNDGNYEKNNCRWATPKEQANNTRNNRIIRFKGKSMTLSRWSDKTGIKRTTIYQRINSGWSVRKALTIKKP